MLRVINSNEFEQETSTGVVLVDFFAEWCAPCKMLAPVLEELSVEMEGKVKILKVDVDKNAGLASKYKVTSIPTMLILKDGEEQNIITGFLPKKSIEENILKYL